MLFTLVVVEIGQIEKFRIALFSKEHLPEFLRSLRASPIFEY